MYIFYFQQDFDSLSLNKKNIYKTGYMLEKTQVEKKSINMR